MLPSADNCWMIEPSYLAGIDLEMATPMGARERFIRRAGVDVGAPEVSVEKGVATVVVDGVLTRRPQFMQYYFDGVSTELLTQQMERLAADDEVRAIVMRVDSPGGEAAGMPELAKAVEAAAARKPVIVHNEGILASGAYYFASKATEIYSSGENYLTGSIGSIIVLRDYSKMFAKAGIETIVAATGPLKGTGVIGAEITKEQREYIQQMADSIQVKFSETVQSGRKLSDDQAKEASTGAVFDNDAAQRLGLIDGVQSVETTLARFQRRSSKPTGGTNVSTQTTNQDQPATLEQLEALPGADEKFIVSAMKRKLDIGQATLELMNAQQAALADRDKKLEEFQQQADTEQRDREELRRRTSASNNQQRSDSDEQLGETGGAQVEETITDPAKTWKQSQLALMKAGMSKVDATRELMQSEPELHEAYKQAVAKDYVSADEQLRRSANRK